LHVANCRFLALRSHGCVASGSLCELRNCEFLASAFESTVSASDLQSHQRLIIDNCLHSDALHIAYRATNPKEAMVQLDRNTCRANRRVFSLVSDKPPNLEKADVDPQVKVLRVEASGNVFDASSVLLLGFPTDKAVPPGAAETYFAHVLAWKGGGNLYAA